MKIKPEKLLDIAITQEKDFLEAHQKRIQFYASLVSAILAATIAGFLKAELWYDYVFLIIGPILAFSLSSIAKGGTFRLYQRFLEAVVMRAKIEQMSGMLEVDSSDGSYWGEEPLVPTRQLEARKNHATSQEFINAHRDAGYQKSTKNLLLVFQAISCVLTLGLFIAASTRYNAQQDGADQPATAAESRSEGNEKPNPESEERPQ